MRLFGIFSQAAKMGQEYGSAVKNFQEEIYPLKI
jgi:hypothetical protein